jgi:hypothetical protein
LMLAFSIGVSLAQASSNPKPHDHVYLLRGFANVFSLGMDQIATKLEHQGIDTTVANYVTCPGQRSRKKPLQSTKVAKCAQFFWSVTRRGRLQLPAWPHA